MTDEANAQQQVSCWYGAGGALVTNDPVQGLSNDPLDDDAARFYGGRYMVAESMSEANAKTIAKALGLNYLGVTAT